MEKPVIKIPAALSMLLKSFGADPEKISTVLNFISEKAFEQINNGTTEKIFTFFDTIERFEKKLDLILQRLPESSLEKFELQTSTLEKKPDGESSSGS